MRAKRVGKVLLVVLGILVGVGVVGGVGFGVWWCHFMHDSYGHAVAKARADLVAHHDRFMQDQERLAKLPFLAPRPGGRDAGPVIRPHIQWTLTLAKGGLRSVPPADKRVAEILDRKFREDVKAKARPPDEWMRTPPEAWKDFDFAWMAGLHELDYWDLDRSAPSDARGGWRDWEPWEPDLLTWAQYRIAKGIHDGDVLPALSDVEELARLCFTTERWTVELWGIQLLAVVRRTRETMPMARAFQPAVSPEDAAALLRALWGAQAFGQLWTPPQYDAELGRFALGRCAGLHDGAWLAHQFRSDLEVSMRADYQRIDRMLADHPECRLRTLRDRWSRTPEVAREQCSDLPDCLMEWTIAGRRARGETVVAMMAAQTYFRRYDEPAGAKP